MLSCLWASLTRSLSLPFLFSSATQKFSNTSFLNKLVGHVYLQKNKKKQNNNNNNNNKKHIKQLRKTITTKKVNESREEAISNNRDEAYRPEEYSHTYMKLWRRNNGRGAGGKRNSNKNVVHNMGVVPTPAFNILSSPSEASSRTDPTVKGSR
eukprot:gene12376-8502_t